MGLKGVIKGLWIDRLIHIAFIDIYRKRTKRDR